MNEQTSDSSQALFRFAVVSQVLARIRGGEPLAQVIRSVAAAAHVFFDGSPRRISPRSLYRWLAAYHDRGIAGLEPKRRSHTASSSCLPPRFVDFLIEQKQQDVAASIPELIRRAVEHGILEANESVHRTTVYRTAKRLGLPVGRCRQTRDRDLRRFAFPHRMDMVLCDGKHFRAGPSRQKRVALFYFDDATRYVLHVIVGSSETAELFQRGLYECLLKHGYMSVIYLDRGPGFIAEDTITVLARLGIPLIHGEVGYKQGRGKVERFNRTVKADLLRGLDGRGDVDPACGALQLRLAHYCDTIYAQRPHESLEGDTPWRRFWTDPKPLRWPEDPQRLRAKFEIWIQRRVTNDNSVPIGSTDYEMPRGYAGRIVTVRRKPLDGKIAFLHKDKVIELLPVDPTANARTPRASAKSHEEPSLMPPTTAADIAFQDDFGPIVDADGGFNNPDPQDPSPKEPRP